MKTIFIIILFFYIIHRELGLSYGDDNPGDSGLKQSGGCLSTGDRCYVKRGLKCCLGSFCSLTDPTRPKSRRCIKCLQLGRKCRTDRECCPRYKCVRRMCRKKRTVGPTQATTRRTPKATTKKPTTAAPTVPACLPLSGCGGQCLAPDPESCNNYQQCVPNGDGTGTLTVRPCPSSLEWDDNKKRCEYAPSPTCYTGPFTCPGEATADLCTEPNDCLYANPESCTSYIRCTPNAQGTVTPVVKDCGPPEVEGDPPLQWDDETKTCVPPDQTTCSIP